jgi:hypothetical protein
MGLVDVRRFDVTTHFGDRGDLEVARIWFADEDTWEIDLAEVVQVNALAVPADRALTYRVLQHEVRLLLSFLVDQPGNPLTLRHTDFRASSGHVKRFVSESFGLGMLTAAAEHHHQWKLNDGSLHNFDVLPAKVAAQYPGSGIRPDLLFDFTYDGHEKRLAGEARGRSSFRPVHFANKDQRDRLADIVAWSGLNSLHPVTMTYTYTYTGAANAQVDLFDITLPDHPATGTNIVMADEEGMMTSQTGQRFEQLAYMRPRALERVGEIAHQLFETAPQDPADSARSVYGRSVRGSWAAADLIAPSRLRFFLGVLNQPLTPEQAGTPRRRRNAAEQRDADPIQVAATGRILVVVARDAAENPDWSEVTSRIE